MYYRLGRTFFACLDLQMPFDWRKLDQMFDPVIFKSLKVQHVFQYLRRIERNQDLYNVNATKVEGDMAECLECLLR